MRKLAVLFAAAAALVFAPAANATITDVMNSNPPAVGLSCATVTSAGNVAGSKDQRWCGTMPGSATTTTDVPLPTDRSTVKTFDGVPLDVNVAFPPEPLSGPDGPYPVVGMYHGYGGSKTSFSGMQRWLQKGYAVFSVTNRGSGESCRSQASIDADPTGCEDGYVHLMDPRFEIRDAQLFLGRLVDDGLVQPNRIAATGGSYGGSESMHFAVLKNRMMMPDGSLIPWTSPKGTPMSTAVATPNIPWTDLIQSLAPNGDTLDYLEDGSFTGVGGVMKESYVNGLYISARAALPGADPSADLAGWKNLLDGGEPYSGAAYDSMIDEITNYHSSYYVDDSQAPAPLLMSSGFTDDLFPVDEVIRYYNRTRANYPDTPMSIFAGSFGHARGQNQANVRSALQTLEEQWIDHYLKDEGVQPESEVTAYLQTCPNGNPGTGPYTAEDWASLAPGEIVLKGGPKQTIAADGGDNAVAAGWNPVTSPNPCTTAPRAVEPGSANYETDDPASIAGISGFSENGFTMMGSATVIANISVANGSNSQIMARLVDLKEGDKTLVARGSWRPEASGFQVFQLHPGAWRVEEGHSLRLELLRRDAVQDAPAILTNYSRPSNDQKDITVEKLELRIPVVEEPGSLNGLVRAPAKKVLPARAGAALAPGYEAIGSRSLANYASQYAKSPKLKGKAKAKGKKVTVKVTCAASSFSCEKSTIVLKAKGKTVAKGKNISTSPGKTKTVKMKMTSKGRKLFKNKGSKKQKKKLKSKVLINGKKSGSVTIKRTGKIK